MRRRGKRFEREGPAYEDLGRGAGAVDPEGFDRASGAHRTDSFEQLEETEPRELVARVVGEAEQADEVFHVRGLDEPEPAVLHVRDVAASELELEEVAVVRGTHEHRLLAERDAFFAVRQDAFADRVDLGVLVGAPYEPRSFTGRRLRAQPGQETFGRARADLVGDVEDRLGRPVVAFQQDGGDLGERGLDVEEVAGARAAEAVDGLRVVADDGQAAIIAAERPQYLDLQRVHVLVLVDADVIDLRREQRPQPVVGRGGAPVEQQIVEVDEAEGPLALHVSATERGDLVDLFLAPGCDLVDDGRQRSLRVDRARIDVEQGRLLREPPPGPARTELVTDEIDDIGRIARVENRETLGQAECERVAAQRAVGNGVECAADDACRGACAASPRRCDQLRVTAVHHLPCGAAGEGQCHDAVCGNAAGDQPRDPRGERGGLARTGPGEDPELVTGEGGRRLLFLVQLIDRGEHVFDHSAMIGTTSAWAMIAA